MTALLDTNILLRIATPNHPMHTTARNAVSKLQADGVRLVLVPQIVYEYWVVATRPAKENGLGMTPLEARQALDQFFETFSVLRDERGIFPIWQSLVVSAAVSGKNAHDTRLVAAMIRHKIGTIITFNVDDFKRFNPVSAIHPTNV